MKKITLQEPTLPHPALPAPPTWQASQLAAVKATRNLYKITQNISGPPGWDTFTQKTQESAFMGRLFGGLYDAMNS